MTVEDLTAALHEFVAEHKFHTRGALSVGLYLTERARQGLPLASGELLADGGAQVKGLNRAAVDKILQRNGIDRPLSSMGGRTNRGTPTQMRRYVDFLNTRHALGAVDLDIAEAFWVDRVREKLAAKPLTLQLDPSHSMRSVIRDLIAQAEKRDAEAPGSRYAGAVLQHLVGAKLDCALAGRVEIAHHGHATADQQTHRAADFVVEDAAIHVTIAPNENLIQRCRENLSDGVRPIIVTTSSKKGTSLAEGLLLAAELTDRVDLFDAEQFIALNLYELAGFAEPRRRDVIHELVARYNAIVEEFETDPAMKIKVKNRRKPTPVDE